MTNIQHGDNPEAPAQHGIGRREILSTPLIVALPAARADTPPARKVLHVAFNSEETSLDPAAVGDLYSRTLTAHIFEALYGYDHLARPPRLIPVLADGLPKPGDDFKVWTVRLKRGIYFADDPAFKGQRRELVAADVFYGFKRVVDPATKSPSATGVLDEGIVGLKELRQAASRPNARFDYDAAIPGMTVIDRYTLQFRLGQARPRFPTSILAEPSIFPAQAREVVEFYGDKIGAHPVGTGPFRLKRLVHGSKIVLQRNPAYRERVYDAQPGADDIEGQAFLKRYAGRRLPMVDEVEVSIIEENQPLWLTFLNGEIDGLFTDVGSLPTEFSPVAVPNGKLAPHLVKRGIQLYRSQRSDISLMYFNMDDPVVGGYTADKVALRRAYALAYDIETHIRLVVRGQGIAAHSPVSPHTVGYDPEFRTDAGDYDPARARALLDMYGYVDRNGDGWRELPDGRVLKLRISSEPEQIYRLSDDLVRRCLTAVGLNCEFEIQQWPAHYKQSQAGGLQIWSLGSSSAGPDGQEALQFFYGPQAGEQNLARFRMPAFDAIYERMLGIPDGPERTQLFLQAKRIAAAYLPYRCYVHRLANDLAHPWVSGYRRPIFWNDWWHMVDVDLDMPRGA